MKLWTIYISIGLLLAGCLEQQQQAHPSAASIDGLTLADVMPKTRENSIPVISFLVTSYEVDLQQAQAVRDCQAALSEQPIRFRDKEAFSINGFYAVVGSGMQISSVNACLERAASRRFSQANLVLNPGFEQTFGQVVIADRAVVDYRGTEGQVLSDSLVEGTLSWALTPEVGPGFPGRIQVTVEPIFIPWAAQRWSAWGQVTEKMTRRFESGKFEMTLGPADFVIIAPRHTDIEQFTAFERLLFLPPGRSDTIRFYALVCLGAED